MSMYKEKQNFTLNNNSRLLIRILSVFTFSLLLSACDPSVYSSDAPRPQNTSSQASPADLARRGNHRAAAEAYRRLAEQNTGLQRDKYFLEAADQWFRTNNYEASQRDLYSIRGVLDSEAQVRKVLLQTRIELELDAPAQALKTINTLRPDNAPGIARPYYALKALALFDLGRLTEGTESFLERENYLRSAREIEDNRQRLWRGLIAATTQGLRDNVRIADTNVNAWVDLASQIADASSRREQIFALESWRETNPQHTAYRIASTNLPKITQAVNVQNGSGADFSQVKKVAVLVPLSGRLGRAGTVIQNGIEVANQQNGNQYQLSFHDTGNDVLSAYASAMRAKPDAIIGPLNKNNIEALSSRFSSVPVLALNRVFDASLNQNVGDLIYQSNQEIITNSNSSPLPNANGSFSNLLQFGLAPEDEAQIAAQTALNNGHTQMVTFTPANEWGDRVLASFAQTFVAGGGRLLETGSYATRDNDHSEAIKSLLNLDESRNRHAQVAALFGEVEYEPRRRQDVDAIFIAAQPTQGRQIRPQLKFHYANRLPVYATSSIYSADATRNKDIDNINLPLSNWEADPYKHYPELASYVDIIDADQTPNTQVLRLFGLGYDALSYMQHHATNRDQAYQGLTGSLKTDEQGLIRRSLPVITIRNGQPN